MDHAERRCQVSPGGDATEPSVLAARSAPAQAWRAVLAAHARRIIESTARADVSILPFDFQGYQMRWGTDETGHPYVVASDFAKGLDYREAKDALRHVDDDEKGRQIVPTPGGDQELWVLYEDGIWELIFQSRKPEAKALKRRVKEILRELRQTGGYSKTPAIPQQERYKAAAEILSIAPPAVSPTWVDQKYRHVVAQALGEEPEVPEEDRLLTVDEYLRDRGVGRKRLRSLRSPFGRTLAALYRERHGESPGKGPRMIDGTTRHVSVYTERDRDLFDRAFETLELPAA